MVHRSGQSTHLPSRNARGGDKPHLVENLGEIVFNNSISRRVIEIVKDIRIRIASSFRTATERETDAIELAKQLEDLLKQHGLEGNQAAAAQIAAAEHIKTVEETAAAEVLLHTAETVPCLWGNRKSVPEFSRLKAADFYRDIWGDAHDAGLVFQDYLADVDPELLNAITTYCSRNKDRRHECLPRNRSDRTDEIILDFTLPAPERAKALEAQGARYRMRKSRTETAKAHSRQSTTFGLT
jgi:hypothetical protein